MQQNEMQVSHYHHQIKPPSVTKRKDLKMSVSPSTSSIPLWETFEKTERSNHHFENNISDRMHHVIESLKYATYLTSSSQRYDLALALVRAAETHIAWLWEIENQRSLKNLIDENNSTNNNDFGSSDDEKHFSFTLRSVTTAAMKLRALCESTTSNNYSSSSSSSSGWMKTFRDYISKVENGTAEDLMLQVLLTSSERDAETLLRLEEELCSKNGNNDTSSSSSFHSSKDLFWLLSDLQNDLKQIQENSRGSTRRSVNFMKTRRKMLDLEEALNIIVASSTSEDDHNNNTNHHHHHASENYVARTTFLAQSYSTLASLYQHFQSSSISSSFSNDDDPSSSCSSLAYQYLVNSLNEVRKILIYNEETVVTSKNGDNNNNNQQHFLENLISSVIIQVSRLFLQMISTNNSSLTNRYRSSERKYNNSKQKHKNFLEEEIEEGESKSIKKLQTLILLVEMISTLCQKLEHENHPSSATSDSLLKDLYEVWIELSENIELLVQSGFVKTGRGQSRIRAQEFQSWLTKYHKKIRVEYSEGDQEEAVIDEQQPEGEEEEDWFDVMRARIHLLKVGREEE